MNLRQSLLTRKTLNLVLARASAASLISYGLMSSAAMAEPESFYPGTLQRIQELTGNSIGYTYDGLGISAKCAKSGKSPSIFLCATAGERKNSQVLSSEPEQRTPPDASDKFTPIDNALVGALDIARMMEARYNPNKKKELTTKTVEPKSNSSLEGITIANSYVLINMEQKLMFVIGDSARGPCSSTPRIFALYADSKIAKSSMFKADGASGSLRDISNEYRTIFGCRGQGDSYVFDNEPLGQKMRLKMPWEANVSNTEPLRKISPSASF